jgi:hypothetical protein
MPLPLVQALQSKLLSICKKIEIFIYPTRDDVSVHGFSWPR